jgi:hypothetical protein
MNDPMEAAQDAARARWYVQEATLGRGHDAIPTVAAVNPTDDAEMWAFIPDEGVWQNIKTKEKQETIPMCVHRDLPGA